MSNILSGSEKALVCLVMWTAAVAICLDSPKAKETTIEKSVGTGVSVVIRGGRDIYLEINSTGEPLAGELVAAHLRTPSRWRSFVEGHTARIPYTSLNDAGQRSAVGVLFPDDYWTEEGWVHFATYGRETGGGETLWSIAEWFTGKGTFNTAIKAHNHKRNNILYKGEKIVIPKRLLLDAFVHKSDKPLYVGMTVGDLTYMQDVQGGYALYKLKRGETLYSDVVGRFTPRIDNDDVNEAVEIIATRSGIGNPDCVAVGQAIKVPIELLASRYRPYGDPARTRYEEYERKAQAEGRQVHTDKLAGVYVILDPGHGGRDPGKIGKFNIQEDDYVYDITCRVKRLLEQRTRATVLMTMRDKSAGYEPIDRDSLPMDTDEYLLTHPQYANGNAAMSVNLRWYLINSQYRKLVKDGVDPDRIVFTSFHADGRYYAMRGTMIFYPSAYHCRGRFGKTGRAYTQFKEVRERQFVEFDSKSRLRAQQVSEQLANHIIQGLRAKNVAVHKSDPVRALVHRHGREYVPGVLRYNEVPTRLLIETVNLDNNTDCLRIKSWKFRERFAQAYVDGIERFFSS